MKPTFVLGIGAQKAGTTWLADYIRADDNYKVGFISQKEFHIWDRVDFPNYYKRRGVLNGSLTLEYLALMGMERFPISYFKYFEKILRNGGLSFDITPSYACLSAQRLSYIRNQFESVGVQVRVVFLMRDPVDRCVSAFRMNWNRLEKHEITEGVDKNKDVAASFLSYVQSADCSFRTNYHSTLQSLDAAFEQDEIGIFLYENMFSLSVMERVSEFIGIKIQPDRALILSNEGKKGPHIPEECLAKCARAYKDVYFEIEKRYPVVIELWRGIKYI
jgi:hypothetical protein